MKHSDRTRIEVYTVICVLVVWVLYLQYQVYIDHQMLVETICTLGGTPPANLVSGGGCS